jgi:hypothetical protein
MFIVRSKNNLWSRILLEKLMCALINRKTSFISDTILITVFTTDRHRPYLKLAESSPLSHHFLNRVNIVLCRSQWPRGLRRGSAAVRLRGLWARIPPGAWMSVSCECCVLSGRGLCVGLITRTEESYRLRCV